MFKRKEKKRMEAKRIENNLKRDFAISQMSRDSVWFYSQMKSGTTYVIIFLLNYINNLQRLSFDKKIIFELLPYFHSIEVQLNKHSPSEIREMQRAVLSGLDFDCFLHTHKNIIDFSDKRIFITRNPFDYLISRHFFHYLNRGNKKDLSYVWREVLEKFVITHKSQVEMSLSQPDTTLMLNYESLILSPKEKFIKILEFLNLECDNDLIELSLSQSKISEVKKIEDVGGKPIVAGENFQAKSFIRSGDIGDWKNYISDDLRVEIEKWLNSRGVRVDNFIIE
ncbi:MAG: sulfotransferase domain-containing protein [Marinomonas sp.]